MPRRLPSTRSAAIVVIICSALMSACSFWSSQPPADDAEVKQALYQQYNQWRGVPYRMGGNSKGGVDCSALVQITYKNAFAMNLPRTTREQVKVGDKVKPGKERSGDLVFFKTGFWDRHVGIYLEKGYFMHASASSGVMISNLAEPYWRKRHWKSRRP